MTISDPLSGSIVWGVMMKSQAPGGPHIINATYEKLKISLRDVLFGDVWICSGQSNMEHTVRHVSTVTGYMEHTVRHVIIVTSYMEHSVRHVSTVTGYMEHTVRHVNIVMSYQKLSVKKVEHHICVLTIDQNDKSTHFAS